MWPAWVSRIQTWVPASPRPLSNLAVPLDSPVLTLNGAAIPPANILFAGLTPTLVGLYQVDFQVPANTPNGSDLLLAFILTKPAG